MNKELLTVDNTLAPQVLKITEDYIVLYKPPRMHSGSGKGKNIIDWCGERFPEIVKCKGHKDGEGGLLHRLDYETHGLLLAARNEKSFESLFDCQKQNKMIKEYCAISTLSAKRLPGFPDVGGILPQEIIANEEEKPLLIESFFRPYGPGRKQVRPVLLAGDKQDIAGDQGNPYRTMVIEKRSIKLSSANGFFFRLRLYRGFRHQIRCHLAWEGFPILNDPLYGASENAETPNSAGYLALRACGISFTEPSSGDEVNFRLPPLTPNDL